MCLAVPGELLEISTADALPTGRISFGGVVKRICLVYTPEATLGDYLLVHAGFSISKIDKVEAERLIDAYSAGALRGNAP